jgi:hypothetical protein
MENVINTKLLEYEKNTFLIDLVEHDSGGKHVRIIQTSQTKTDKPERSVMDISFELLPDFISVLNDYGQGMKTDGGVVIKVKPKTPDEFFSDVEKMQMEKRYLKGVSLKDLTIQFDTDEATIEYILKKRGVEIVAIDKVQFRSNKRR